MKSISPIRIIGFAGFFVVSVFVVVIIFLNQIESEISHLISIYGYPAIFFIALIVDVLAQPIGPEIPLLSGKLVGLNIVKVALITITGSVLASFINYNIGKLFYEKIYGDKKYGKYLVWYRKYGKYGLLVSALGPVPYVPFCWFSGAFGLSIRKFLYFGLIPRIIRIIFVSFALVIFL